MNILLVIVLALTSVPARAQERQNLGGSGPSAEETSKAQAAAARENTAAETGRQSLEGTRWKARMVTLGFLPHFWESDELQFLNGMFASNACTPLGFAASVYESRPSADGFAWTSTQQNPGGEKTEWKGTRIGDRMSGAVTWTRADKVKTYRWKARLIKKK